MMDKMRLLGFKGIGQKVLMQKPAIDELRKDYSFLDMHVHTKYSHDSKTSISLLMRKAHLLGIGFSAIDHQRAEGSLEVYKQKDILTIPGIEVASREGKEVLIYFYSAKDLAEYYEKFIKSTGLKGRRPKNPLSRSIKLVKSNLGMADIVEKADRYACLKSVPHPYAYGNKSGYLFFSKKKMRSTMHRIEAVEVMNSAVRPYMNRNAKDWAIRHNKAFTGGSDAHRLEEFGNVFVACKANTVEGVLDEIRKKRNLVIGKEMRMTPAFKAVFEIGRNKRSADWEEII
ncbi:MAG: PHP domain-containing protein [archaeon]